MTATLFYIQKTNRILQQITSIHKIKLTEYQRKFLKTAYKIELNKSLTMLSFFRKRKTNNFMNDWQAIEFLLRNPLIDNQVNFKDGFINALIVSPLNELFFSQMEKMGRRYEIEGRKLSIRIKE